MEQLREDYERKVKQRRLQEKSERLKERVSTKSESEVRREYAEDQEEINITAQS